MNKQSVCKYILGVSDLILCLVSLPIALAILAALGQDISVYIPDDQLDDRIFLHIGLSTICIAWFWIQLRHYTYRKPFWFELKEILVTLFIISIIDLAILAFSKLYFSRYLWGITWGTALIIVPSGRILLKNLFIKTKLYLKDTIIIGGGQNAIDAYKALVNEKYLGFKVKFFIAKEIDPAILNLGIPIINEYRNSLWECLTTQSDQFIIALEDEQNAERDHWLRILSKKSYRAVSVIPTLRGLPLYSTNMSFIFSYDVILLRINHNLAKRSSRMLKRTMDIICSVLGLIILSPIFLLLSYLIKKDGGVAIYKHTRIGREGKEFDCLKFRTMVVNSDQILTELLDNNLAAKLEWEKDFKLKNDPRITKVGHFLRRTSIDELPQLWNVLKGEMSLVGPRPIIKDELQRYEEDIDYYLMAKPGMTGLWQISGRNDVDYKTRVYFDAWYVKNWSLWNDIAILFKTIRTVLKRNGAY